MGQIYLLVLARIGDDELCQLLQGYTMARNVGIFRVMGPDETASNRLEALFEVTSRIG